MENTSLHTDLYRYIAVLTSRFDISQEVGCINIHSRRGEHLFEISRMPDGWALTDYRVDEFEYPCYTLHEAIETVYILTEIPM